MPTDLQRSLRCLRASVRFALRALDLRLDGTKFFDHLILLVVLQDADRPVVSHSGTSIRGIADGLHLPHETTRRHAVRLLRAGVLAQGRHGVYVPEGSGIHADFERARLRITQDLRLLLRSLEGAGWLEPGARTQTDPFEADKHDPFLSHLAFDFAIRTLEVLVEHSGHIKDALILALVLDINLENVPDHQMTPPAAGEPAAGARLSHLRPASLNRISAALGMSVSVVRRCADRLVIAGRFRREGAGLVLSDRELYAPELLEKNRASVTKLQNDLRSHGI